MSAGIAQMVQGKLCDKKGMFWWSTELSRGAPKIGMFWRFCNAISSGIKSLGQKNEVCSTPADHEPTSQNGRDFKAQFLTKMENLFRAVARIRYFLTCCVGWQKKTSLSSVLVSTKIHWHHSAVLKTFFFSKKGMNPNQKVVLPTINNWGVCVATEE